MKKKDGGRNQAIALCTLDFGVKSKENSQFNSNVLCHYHLNPKV
jgi:hypothetical protein